MQTASILLAIGGERDMQVPKFGVTPAEVMLLRAIHGEEAVTDINIIGDEDRNSRAERERLFSLYAKSDPSGAFKLPVLDALYPGVSSRLPTEFSELELADEFYVAEVRKTPEQVDPLDHDENGKKGGSKKRAKKAEAEAEPAPEPEPKAGEAPEGDQNLFQ
jgi:hypothetical protein